MDQSPFPAVPAPAYRRRRQEYRGKDVVDAATAGRVAVAFVVFCLASSGIYPIDDATTAASDRAHPAVRSNPIAAGAVSVRGAWVSAVVLLAASLLVALAISVQLAYRLALTNVAVIDICLVAAGFLLRAIAGGVAAEISLSMWFLLVMASGSIFFAAGKRYAELTNARGNGARLRPSLQYYTPTYLRFVWTLGRDRAGRVLQPVRLRTRRPIRQHLVRAVVDPLHHRRAVLRGIGRRGRGRRTGGDSPAQHPPATAGPRVDRDAGRRNLPLRTRGQIHSAAAEYLSSSGPAPDCDCRYATPRATAPADPGWLSEF